MDSRTRGNLLGSLDAEDSHQSSTAAEQADKRDAGACIEDAVERAPRKDWWDHWLFATVDEAVAEEVGKDGPEAGPVEAAVRYIAAWR